MRQYTLADFYWWHRALLIELERGPYNEHGLADNTKSSRMDTGRWLDQLASMGVVIEAEPEFDYPARWFELTDDGRDLLKSGKRK